MRARQVSLQIRISVEINNEHVGDSYIFLIFSSDLHMNFSRFFLCSLMFLLFYYICKKSKDDYDLLNRNVSLASNVTPYCNERATKRKMRSHIFFFLFYLFLLSPTNELPVSLYDVQHAPFLLSTSMALLVAAVHGNYSPLHFKYSNP